MFPHKFHYHLFLDNSKNMKKNSFMQNSAAESISKLILSGHFLSDRSYFNTPGVSSTEVKDEIFALKARQSNVNIDLPKDFIELISKWNGFSISFSLKADSVLFSDMKFKFEIFSFGKSEKFIRNFYDVNSKSISCEYLLIGYSNCYCETENGNTFGNGYIALDHVGHYWHVDKGDDDFHPSHLMGKSIAEVCDYLFPKI